MTTGRGACIRFVALWLLTAAGSGQGLTAISANGANKKVAISLPQKENLLIIAQPSEEPTTYAPVDLDTDIPVHNMAFGTDNNTLVTSQTGSTAYLPCLIHHIGDGIVSWIRKKDYHLLTVGLTTYSSDQRFQAVHLQHSEDWTLQVKYVQKRDAGIYECQVSTHPPTSIFLRLEVVEASAQIFGPSEKYLKPGSALRLQCSIIKTTEAPSFVFWYHNRRMINYDWQRGVNVSVDTVHRTSQLVIAAAAASHTGNYTCVPNNARPASIYVHIFNGENPAAMQSGSTGLWMWWCTSFRLVIIANIISHLCR